MSSPDWCREEVLKARRFEGAMPVEPRAARVRRWLGFGLLIVLLAAAVGQTPVSGALVLAGEVQAQDFAGSSLAVDVPELCGSAVSRLMVGAAVDVRRRDCLLCPWRPMSVARVAGCPGGSELHLGGPPMLADGEAGAALLVRVATTPRRLFTYLQLGVEARQGTGEAP